MPEKPLELTEITIDKSQGKFVPLQQIIDSGIVSSPEFLDVPSLEARLIRDGVDVVQ